MGIQEKWNSLTKSEHGDYIHEKLSRLVPLMLMKSPILFAPLQPGGKNTFNPLRYLSILRNVVGNVGNVVGNISINLSE